MLHYQEIQKQLETLEYRVIKNNKKVEYIDLSVGFDIETTSQEINGIKTAYMYIWQFGIGFDSPVYYGRTWEELQDLLYILKDHFNLSENRLLPVYVHNLEYEFQFMRKYFHWANTFSLKQRKPIRATTFEGIEFRDSYALSGQSLAGVAKNLINHEIKKMEGDLDYKLIRTHRTELTPKEIQYCINDIKIITAYINEERETYGDVTKIPMTNTGRVRKYVRDNCFYIRPDGGKAGYGQKARYWRIMQDLKLTLDDYKQLSLAFMGGFTHANANYSGQLLHNVSSIDFTSSYPSVMISEKFPMTSFMKYEPESLTEFRQICKTHAVIFDVKFTNLRQKITQESYLSENKCFNIEKGVINNGRIREADSLMTILTEIDLEIIDQVYSYDSIQVKNVKKSRKGYLPKPIIKSILKLYQDKTVLKDVEGAEVEYMLSKGMLNSIYGMCVTAVVKDETGYSDSHIWYDELANPEETIQEYNDNKNRFLFYGWGVWVTAYARRNLWSGIIAVGDDYVYSDTDSLKILNYEKHKPYIEAFDKQIINKMVTMCKNLKFSVQLLNPKTKEGKEKMLGVWDFEGTYQNFKTLGAKKYMTDENGKLTQTISGLSKRNGLEYMLEQCNGDNLKVFEMFDDNLTIPPNRTGKSTHTYIDELLEFETIDYNGKMAFVSVESGTHLEDCGFTLSIGEEYKKFLSQLRKGYIYKGLDYK